MSFTFRTELSQDKSAVSIQLNDGPKIIVNTADLENIIYHLGLLRSSMVPPRPTEMTPETRFSSVLAIRWQLSEGRLPGRVRLSLLHPGFGWITIGMDKENIENMSNGARLFLEQPAGGSH